MTTDTNKEITQAGSLENELLFVNSEAQYFPEQALDHAISLLNQKDHQQPAYFKTELAYIIIECVTQIFTRNSFIDNRRRYYEALNEAFPHLLIFRESVNTTFDTHRSEAGAASKLFELYKALLSLGYDPKLSITVINLQYLITHNFDPDSLNLAAEIEFGNLEDLDDNFEHYWSDRRNTTNAEAVRIAAIYATRNPQKILDAFAKVRELGYQYGLIFVEELTKAIGSKSAVLRLFLILRRSLRGKDEVLDKLLDQIEQNPNIPSAYPDRYYNLKAATPGEIVVYPDQEEEEKRESE